MAGETSPTNQEQQSLAITANTIGVRDTWRASLLADETLNDSDKIFTVPALTEYQILWIWVELSTTAVVGPRQLEIQLQDLGGDIIGQWQAGVTQAASLTYNYLFAIAIPDLMALRDTNFLMTPLPAGTFLAAGQKIRIWDNKVVDATHDDMNIQMQIASRAV